MSTAADAVEGYLDGSKVSLINGDQLGPAAAMSMCSLLGAVVVSVHATLHTWRSTALL